MKPETYINPDNDCSVKFVGMNSGLFSVYFKDENGLFHHEGNKPAVIHFYSNGKIKRHHYKHGDIKE